MYATEQFRNWGLTSRQVQRLRYIAFCGPVFRIEPLDARLEELNLVRPFRKTRIAIEATEKGRRACNKAHASGETSWVSFR